MSETQTTPEPTATHSDPPADFYDGGGGEPAAPAAEPDPKPEPEEPAATEAAAEPAAEAEPETEPADDKPKKDPWFVRRLAQQTAQLAAATKREAEMAERLRKFEAGEKPAPTEPDFDKRVQERAAQIQSDAAFNAECDRVAATGIKAFPDFNEKLNTLWAATNGFNRGLVEASLETGDPHKVLYELGSDPDEAERIAGLPPHRMGAALAKLAAKPAPVKPPVSKVPPPISPVAGASRGEPRPDGSMKDFDSWFESQRRH